MPGKGTDTLRRGCGVRMEWLFRNRFARCRQLQSCGHCRLAPGTLWSCVLILKTYRGLGDTINISGKLFTLLTAQNIGQEPRNRECLFEAPGHFVATVRKQSEARSALFPLRSVWDSSPQSGAAHISTHFRHCS